MVLMLATIPLECGKIRKTPWRKTEVSFRLKTSEPHGRPYPAPEFRVLGLYGLRALSAPSSFRGLVIARGNQFFL